MARPVTLAEPPATHAWWVIDVLVRELHFSAAEIASLSKEEAVGLVHERWSRGA
jgi:hypothetical protein